MIYAKLLRFRDDQLENYQGPGIEYSVSDYHHAPRRALRRSSTLASFKGQALSHRHVSQYSILDEGLGNQRKPSVAETEQSYDPYRPSRNQIQKTQADQAKVTVIRGSSESRKLPLSNTSLDRRAVSKTSARNPALGRVQETEAYSIASSPPMVSASIGRLNSSINEQRISRSMSTTCPVRTSMSYKRGVSFAHIRKGSATAGKLRVSKKRGAATHRTLQQRYVQDGPMQASVSPQPLLAADSPPNLLQPIRSRKNPTRLKEEVSARKAESASLYWKEDARKVSTELEKFCDEAFNRASVASTIATTAPTENFDLSYESPATSLGIPDSRTSLNTYRAVRRMDVKDSYLNRPLPLPPSLDHLGSYTYRELAKTRALLKERAADTNMIMGPGYFDEVIAHLDRLMQPSTINVNQQDQRVVSAPDQPIRQPNKDEFEMLLARGPFGLRSASEPVSKPPHKDWKGRKAIRAVSEQDQKPISPTKPLTIRKKSRSSTAETASDRQRRLRGKSYTENSRPYDRSQGAERRSAGLSLLESSLEPIEEDEDKENRDARNSKTFFGDGKKRAWFRRHESARRSQDSDKGGPPPTKEDLSAQDHQGYGAARDKSSKRVSDGSSVESRVSENNKASIGKARFFKIFSRRESKETKHSADRGSGGKFIFRWNTCERNG